MKHAILIGLALGLAACASAPRTAQLVDSPLWPRQHQMAAEEVCEGSEDVAACSAEVRAERLAAGRPEGPSSPR